MNYLGWRERGCANIPPLLYPMLNRGDHSYHQFYGSYSLAYGKDQRKTGLRPLPLFLSIHNRINVQVEYGIIDSLVIITLASAETRFPSS
jgi:hypothetical protein